MNKEHNLNNAEIQQLNIADVSRSLFLELAVRTNRTMPEREEELAWFDEGTDFKKCGDFHERFFKEIDRIRNDG